MRFGTTRRSAYGPGTDGLGAREAGGGGRSVLSLKLAHARQNTIYLSTDRSSTDRSYTGRS